jgi:hypothetical protein
MPPCFGSSSDIPEPDSPTLFTYTLRHDRAAGPSDAAFVRQSTIA